MVRRRDRGRLRGRDPEPGYAEIDPQAGSRLARRAAPAAGSRTCRGCGSGSPGRCTVWCWSTTAGQPCRPAVLWPDRRAEPVWPQWRALAGGAASPPGQPDHARAWPGRSWTGCSSTSRTPWPGRARALQPKDYVRAAAGRRRAAPSAATPRPRCCGTCPADRVGLGRRRGARPPRPTCCPRSCPAAQVGRHRCRPAGSRRWSPGGRHPSRPAGSGGLARRRGAGQPGFRRADPARHRRSPTRRRPGHPRLRRRGPTPGTRWSRSRTRGLALEPGARGGCGWSGTQLFDAARTRSPGPAGSA